MEIAFKTTKLMKIFNSEKELIKTFGRDNAKKIKIRMAILCAAPSLADVPSEKPDRCHQLKGNRKGTFAVYLEHPYRLIFTPNYEIFPKKEDGGIDLSQIKSIIISGVEDYH